MVVLAEVWFRRLGDRPIAERSTLGAAGDNSYVFHNMTNRLDLRRMQGDKRDLGRTMKSKWNSHRPDAAVGI